MNAFMFQGPAASQSGQDLVMQDGMHPLQAETTLTRQLAAGLDYLKQRITVLPEPYGGCALFFTVSAPGEDACAFFVRRATLDAAWREGATRIRQWAWVRSLEAVQLRVDWPRDIAPFPSQPVSSWKADSASAWAMADESLENARLTLPLQPLDNSLDAPELQTSHPSRLLLRLQGLYVGEAAAPIALPRVPWSMLRRSLHHAPVQQLPYLAALNVLAPQQHAQGHWAGTSLRDHLGITYALLLIRQHIGWAEPAHALLAQTLERAIGHLHGSIDALLQPPHAKTHTEQAQCLLVLAHYTSGLHCAAAPAELQASMNRLVQSLRFVRHGAAPQLSAWVELALSAYAQWQANALGRAEPQPAAHSTLSVLGALQSLTQPYWQSLHTASRSNDHGNAADSTDEDWQVIAMVEGALLDMLPSGPQHLHADHWHADLQRPVLCAMRHTVWPECAIFLPPAQREQAAFFDPPSAHGLVNSPRATAYLLVTAYALLRLADNQGKP